MDISEPCFDQRSVILSCLAAHGSVLSSFTCPHAARARPWEFWHNLKIIFTSCLKWQGYGIRDKNPFFINKCRDIYSSKHRKYLLLCLTEETTGSQSAPLKGPCWASRRQTQDRPAHCRLHWGDASNQLGAWQTKHCEIWKGHQTIWLCRPPMIIITPALLRKVPAVAPG